MKFLPIAIACAIAGCQLGPKQTEEGVRWRDDTPLVSVPTDDLEMEAAIRQAKQSMPSFLARLAKPKPDEVYLVKAALPADKGGREHIWLDNVSYKNGIFKGTLAADPFDIKGLKEGSQVEVKVEDATDWLIAAEGRMEGAFSEAVLQKRLAQAEKRAGSAK